jgi:lipopolysaccharide export system permease protein
VKILDRYLLVNFLKNYVISFLVLVGLYIALDMVFNFDNLVEPPKVAQTLHLSAPRILYDIASYYAYQTPVIFVYLSGMIAVAAAAFTLLRLSRFNELTAILAAGISLRRLALPIILAGVALNALLLADQELLIPRILPEVVRSHDQMHTATPRSYSVEMMRDNHNGLLCAARYTPPAPGRPATILYLDVVERDAQLRPDGHLYADKAVWESSAKLWRLTNGQYVNIPGAGGGPPQAPKPVATYQSDITPDEIAIWRGGQYVQFLSTHRIDELLQRPKSYGVNNLLRTKNLRFTQPLANVILLLLACPAMLVREQNKLKLAVLRCLLWCGLCIGSVFLAYQLAAAVPNPAWVWRWPLLMAWLPIFIFGPLSVWLLDRMKT